MTSELATKSLSKTTMELDNCVVNWKSSDRELRVTLSSAASFIDAV